MGLLTKRILLLALGTLSSFGAGAATPASIADGYAGFSVRVKEPRQWVSQLTHSPGVTSKLCLRRQLPDVLVCIQSLLTPIRADELEDLADGFVLAIAQRFQVPVPDTLVPVHFQAVSGFAHQFTAPAALAPDGLTNVWLFAGRGPRGQAQMVIAFTGGGLKATDHVQSTIDSLHYHANAR